MKIAVTYAADGQIFQHFGHTQQLKVYDVEDKTVVNSTIIDTGKNGHGAMAGFLKGLEAEVLICGGIGGGAKNALSQAGIAFFPYVQGRADDAVQAFLAGNLVFDMNKTCAHHSDDQNHETDCAHHHHDTESCAMRDTCGKHN